MNKQKLEELKSRFMSRLVDAEAAIVRHTGVRGYGNETCLAMAENRAIALKQKIYEINLILN